MTLVQRIKNVFKPVAAVIVVSRRTAEEETASITVNASAVDRKVIFDALTEAGEALRARLVENNTYLDNAVKDVIPAMKVKR